jgi:hypothetical protein
MEAEWQGPEFSMVTKARGAVMKETVLVCLVLTIAWLISLIGVAAHRSEVVAMHAARQAEAAMVAAMLAE